jgi:hypothetical protein
MRTAFVLAALVACTGSARRDDHVDDRADDDPWAAKRPARSHSGPATDDECVAAAKGGLGDPGTVLGPAADEQLRADREKVVVRLCREDQWPATIAQCYADARGLQALGKCSLPAEASQHLTSGLQRVMRSGLHLP